MEYYGNNDYRDYLALRHHGILGMKWGKRNGPPYPLGSSDHSASEKKAGWRKSLERGGGPRTTRQYQKALNKLDKVRSKYHAKDIKEDTRMEKMSRKTVDERLYGSKKKSKKAFDKLVESAYKQADYKREVAEIDKAKKELIDKAIKSGMKVSSKDRLRYQATGKQIAANVIAGPIGNLALGAYQAYDTKKNYKNKGKNKVEYERKGKSKTINETPYIVKGEKYKVELGNSAKNLASETVNLAKSSKASYNPYIGLPDLETMKPPGPVGSKKYEQYIEALADSMDLDYKNGKFKARPKYR